MSATTLNKSDHTHTDLYVMTAPDSLSAVCICMGLIAETWVCFHPNPKQGLVYITYHTEAPSKMSPIIPTPPPGWG